MTVKAVFFDFGGVLGRLNRNAIADWEKEHGVPEGGLLRALYGTPEWREAESGRIHTDRWFAAADTALAEGGKPVPPAQSIWSNLWNDMDQDVIALARRLQSNHKIGVLSNTTVMLEEHVLVPHGIHDMWDVIINSARVGIAKPDAGIYHAAARAVGLPPEACLHIDDLQSNVEGAEAAGFKAVLHRGDFKELTGRLKSLGVAV
jgi:putative hydrolase of the HAD superfamily